ncbi:MAG: immunoglobulin-like domain-containing protein [Candidatus Dadabacteria bacterium]
MKKLHYIFILASLLFTFSCKEDLTSEGVSRVTTYVKLTMTGENFMSIPVGSSYTEPGIAAKEGETTVDVTTTGTVDTSKPGVYTISYGATNKDGFPVSEDRIVCVYDATAAANDFSGNYARTSNGSVAVWKKVAPGMYTVNNPGGAPGTNLTIHVFNPTGNILRVPSQVSSDGSITSAVNATGGDEITMNPGPPASYLWIILNPGYGTGKRTFNKQ